MKELFLAMGLGTLAGPLAAQDSTPLSAIDWLSQSVRIPEQSIAPSPRVRDEPPVATSVLPPRVNTTPLDGRSPDPIGLLAPSVTALPATLWAGSDEEVLIALLRAENLDPLPAMQELLQTLLLAEADAPLGASPEGLLFQARVDKLLDLGAIEPARGLLEQAQIDSPTLFRRWFDIALLLGTEDEACRVMQRRIDVAPTYAARIFCLARSGDWTAAALSLKTHIALDDLSETEADLLSRFLDPELYEGEPPLGPPTRISPLMFRMYEAIGERLTTTGLPRAFTHADLQRTVGWKTQLEAAERLTRHGAIPPNVIFALYTSRTPSASGGIWDRAGAIQDFEAALASGEADKIAATLPAAWAAAQEAGIQLAFADQYHAQLLATPLAGKAAEIAFVLGLLSPDYEIAAEAFANQDPRLIAVANGMPDPALGSDRLYQAIAAAFGSATPPAALMDLAQRDQLGEALLRAIALFDVGRDGDLTALTEALSFLRAVGLEDLARRASLQLMLLERPA